MDRVARVGDAAVEDVDERLEGVKGIQGKLGSVVGNTPRAGRRKMDTTVRRRLWNMDSIAEVFELGVEICW